MLWFWLFAFCVFGFVVSLNVQAMNFAFVPIFVFGVMAVIQGVISYNAGVRERLNSYPYYVSPENENETETENAKSENENENENETTQLTGEISETTFRETQGETQGEIRQRYKSETNESELARRKFVLRFLYLVSEIGLVSESEFVSRNIPAKDYRQLIGLLTHLDIVSDVVPGGRRKVLVTELETAMQIFENYCAEAGLVGYWQPLKEHYDTESLAPYYRNNVARGYIRLNLA